VPVKGAAYSRTSGWRRYALVGNGLLSKQRLADVMTERDRLRDAYFVWDAAAAVTRVRRRDVGEPGAFLP
jgi:hypothetical protein